MKNGLKSARDSAFAFSYDTKRPLFWATALTTILYFALILIRFLGGPEAAQIPAEMGTFYFFLLSAYVSVKELSRAAASCNGNQYNGRRGEVFVGVWILLYLALLASSAFNVGYGEVTKEILSTEIRVLALYVGGEILKNIKNIAKLVRDIVRGEDTSKNNK